MSEVETNQPKRSTMLRWEQEVRAAGFRIGASGQVWVPCKRCGGSGTYAFNPLTGDECFGCYGKGYSLQNIEKVAKRLRQRESSKRSAAKKKIAKKQASIIQAAQTIKADTELRAAFAGAPSGFIRSIAQSLFRWGSISDAQRAAVVKARPGADKFVAMKKASAEAAIDIPAEMLDGRVRVEGRVISAKWKESQYGCALKMLIAVETPDGGEFKLWGSVPGAIEEEVYKKFPGFEDVDVLRRCRVAFDAKIEVSQDDKGFGFYKRPTKVAMLAMPTKENLQSVSKADAVNAEVAA